MEGISEAVLKTALPKSDIKALVDCATRMSGNQNTVQVFDIGSIASREHLLGAYLNALLAFKNHTNRAKSIGMEMLLFTALTDQISDAVRIAGAKPGSRVVVFASSQAEFSKIAPMLKDVADFNPSEAHRDSVLRRLGIKNTGDAHEQILQAMAVSRLGA
jgi:tRNA threonylcarbamoyladenosine modification (KEOPS) complex Cgi121 subunit